MKRIAFLALALSPIGTAHVSALAAETREAGEAPAFNPKLAAAQTFNASGNYAEVVRLLEKESFASPAEEGRRAYLLATAFAKLQAFDRALPYYQAAVRLSAPYPSLAYEYGQALFATQLLGEAEEQFKASITAKHKVAASAYYVAYVRQLQENYGGAADFYRRIQRMEGDPDRVKQPALFQLAELEYERTQRVTDLEPRAEALRMDVLPLFEAARDYTPGTQVAEQATARIAEIAQVTNAAASRMANGIPLPLKPYALRLSEEIGYDSNVITLADDALVDVSGKDSPYSRTSVLGKYQFNFDRAYSVIPELNLAATFYGRRSEPRVYQNDNIVFAPAVRSKYEHVSRGAPATALFDVEFNYMLRDYPQDHSLPYYSRSWNFALAERVKWLDTGTTTLRLAFKFFENFDPRRNALSPALTLQQNVRILGAYDLQNSFTVDYFRARDAEFDETNYRLRQAVAFPRLFEKVDVLPSLNLQLKDTMRQSYFRGTEFLFNPSISLLRPFAKNLEGSLEYSFSKNFSKSDDLFQYTKHEAKVGIAYSL